MSKKKMILWAAGCFVAFSAGALELVEAKVGGENSWVDVTGKMEAYKVNDDLYLGAQNPVVMAGRDPLPRKAKHYVVTYRDDDGREHTVRFQTNRFAFTSGVPEGKGDHVTFFRAWYGAAGNYVDVTGKIREVIETGRELTVRYANLGVADPARGRKKELYVFYLLGGEIRFHLVEDGGRFDVGDIDVPFVRLRQAIYGAEKSWAEIEVGKLEPFRINDELFCGVKSGRELLGGKDPARGKRKGYELTFLAEGRIHTADSDGDRFAVTSRVPEELTAEFQFYRAWYGYGRTYSDVTENVRNMIRDKKGGEVSPAINNGVDPARGKKNDLYVFYVIDNSLKFLYLQDGQKFDVSEIDGTKR